MDERVRQAGLLYERAVFSGETGPLAEADRQLNAAEADRQLNAAEADPAVAEADLAVARGRILHTRFLLRRDEDPAAAEADPGELALFERAAQLYRELGDLRGESEALFWVEAHAAGRLDAARRHLEESTRLRREIGQLPGRPPTSSA